MAEESEFGASVETILVPIDVSVERDRAALYQVAIMQARLHGARLHFLSVVPEIYLATSIDPTGTIKQMIAQTQDLLDKEIAQHVPDDVTVETGVRYGPVSAVIIERAREIATDLIVIGARHSGLVAYALGSVASRVVNHAPCSVYVLQTGSRGK